MSKKKHRIKRPLGQGMKGKKRRVKMVGRVIKQRKWVKKKQGRWKRMRNRVLRRLRMMKRVMRVA